jgi:cholera toxin transcriptional activator
MEAAVKARAVVHFGEFELDAAAGQLYRNGAKLRLQEQPFQMLQVLQRPGEVITREELCRKIWRSDTFVI